MQLDSVMYKLQRLKHSHTGRVNVIHIGDSHIQADGMTSVIREGMQQYFGNAGRGIVFPYQLAGSNAPRDVRSSSNTSWKSNKITTTEKPLPVGISGYGLHSNSATATVSVGLKDMEGRQERFNKMVFFLCTDRVCYSLSDSDLSVPVVFYSTNEGKSVTVNTEEMITGFKLARVNAPDNADYGFYGVSLEKRDTPGVVYHSIGVNGARYDQYLQSDLFWEQLKELNGDLFVISMGTNEAQNQAINPVTFAAMEDSFLQKIYSIAPRAAVIITTPAASYYKKKKPNKAVQTVAESQKRACAAAKVSCWDLLDITGGLPAAAAWKKYGLIGADLVHYTQAGYQLQGQLFAQALASCYSQYEKVHPYKPTTTMPAAPTRNTPKKTTTTTDIIDKPLYTNPAKPTPVVVQQPTPVPAKTDTIRTVVPVKPAPRPNSHITVEYSD